MSDIITELHMQSKDEVVMFLKRLWDENPTGAKITCHITTKRREV